MIISVIVSTFDDRVERAAAAIIIFEQVWQLSKARGDEKEREKKKERKKERERERKKEKEKEKEKERERPKKRERQISESHKAIRGDEEEVILFE